MYTIQIKGMHCSGCKNLITLSLEDAGFTNVTVDEQRGIARFDADLSEVALEAKLSDVFQELTEYSYSSLNKE